jgi:hypothetical protein
LKEIKVSKSLIILFIILGIWAGVYSVVPLLFATPPKNPHKEIFKGKCLDCHEDVPKKVKAEDKDKEKTSRRKRKRKKKEYRVALFKKDIVSLCTQCHEEMDSETLHPLDIKPTQMKSDLLPLDSDGTLTCVTCHFPHGESYSEKQYVGRSSVAKWLSLLVKQKYFKTYYLREKVLEGEICKECHEVEKLATEKRHLELKYSVDDYAGSEKCGECHQEEYDVWKKTPHAKIIMDPQKNKTAIMANFEDAPPFSINEVKYTIGLHWTQRYISERKGKLYVRSPIWSIQEEKWNTKYWKDMLWIKYCGGCHTTGYSPVGGGEFSEMGITCEACHGPGKKHSETESVSDIVNPQKLYDSPETKERKDMICESCHTTGHDPTGEFKFPVGFYPGEDIQDYYIGLLPKPGQDASTFAGDNTYEDRHQQYLFFQDAFFKARGVTCDICKNFRAQKKKDLSEGKEKEFLTPSEYCMTCHQRDLKRTELHMDHLIEEVDCHDCHQPKLSLDKERYSIHDHKFMFMTPEYKEAFAVEESCVHCHKGKQL